MPQRQQEAALETLTKDVWQTSEIEGEMLDATGRYDWPLTDERLFCWHAALFPAGMTQVKTGAWCAESAGPMQVVPGAAGREKVHDAIDPILKSGLVHLWFVTVHPFEDGNGRIARAFADMALARSEQSPQRSYSMSAQIKLEHNAYYDILGTQHELYVRVAAIIAGPLSDMGQSFTFS